MTRKEPPGRLEETMTKPAVGAPRAPDLRWLCLVVSGTRGVSIIPVPRAETVVVGRSVEAEVVIADDSVSRRHARLHLGDPLEQAARRLAGIVWTSPDRVFLAQLAEHLGVVQTDEQIRRLEYVLQGRPEDW